MDNINLNDLLPYVLPIITGFVAWFFSRGRQRSEAAKIDADTKAQEAQKEKTMAEAQAISVSSANLAIGMWTQLYNQIQTQNAQMKEEVRTVREKTERLEKMISVYLSVVNYLLSEMTRYNPEIAATARKMLEEGLSDGASETNT